MNNKKIVATLLHACTLYCVSAYNVQEYDAAGHEHRPNAGEVATNRAHIARHDEAAFRVLSAPASDLSVEIRLLLKTCSVARASLFSLEQVLQYFPSFDTGSNILLQNLRRQPLVDRQPLLKRACFAPDICSEGNATWIKYCLTSGP
ncbi:MAG: hypothetical protein KDC61_02700 [Saprospiraceae bacterium]|nr:hypothetical protein [Saprospiraceae bacterium]